jgi:predicted phosphodiesterase
VSAHLPDRFAVLSDIHGNLFALDAVLADIASQPAAQSVVQTVNLGDHLQGPLDPVGTAERLMPLRFPSIRGNCDRHLFEDGTIAAPGSTLAANRQALRAEHKQWLAAMPQTLSLNDILFCHGTPWADDVYLLEEITPEGARSRRTEEIAPTLDGIAARLILCGHSHQSRTLQMPGGPLLVNPGSVGLPAYTEESPHPHAMEAGSPHARYAIVTRSAARWEVEHRAVTYDWEAAAQLAERNGRHDWAGWLRTGRIERVISQSKSSAIR